ncbi:MAG: hypothetical protein CM15mP46_2070 [Alphaproteobacteria bacterium]|nr:MAG: hypothetical protein CM15mP46_2070 [Alphaproteobacteria bacterium]
MFSCVSIVEQENWGNAVSALACYYFAMGAAVFAASFARWVVSIANDCYPIAITALCQLQAGVYVSLMGVLIGCRGGWLCLCQLGHQRAAKSPNAARNSGDFTSFNFIIKCPDIMLVCSAGGWFLAMVAPVLRVFEPD